MLLWGLSLSLTYRNYAIHSHTIFSNFSLFGATIFQGRLSLLSIGVISELNDQYVFFVSLSIKWISICKRKIALK